MKCHYSESVRTNMQRLSFLVRYTKIGNSLTFPLFWNFDEIPGLEKCKPNIRFSLISQLFRYPVKKTCSDCAFLTTEIVISTKPKPLTATGNLVTAQIFNKPPKSRNVTS